MSDIRLNLHETAKPTVYCFPCQELVVLEDGQNAVADAVRGMPPRCSGCKQPTNVWVWLHETLKRGGLAMLAPIGLRHTVIAYTLPVNGVVEFDLRKKGVSGTAQILRLRHRVSTPGVKAVDLHADDRDDEPDFTCAVFGAWVGSGSPPDNVQGSTTVTWAPHDDDDIGRQGIVTALDAFANDRHRDAIIPANVAVEATLYRVLFNYLTDVGISRKRSRDFLQTAATYSHQLNVLLPTIIRSTNAPAMPDQLRGTLNRLRGLRNEVAHEGQTETPLTRALLAEFLTSVVFAFHYIRMLEQILIADRAGR